ncbi:MAG: ADYC domain-containing protein [bacterium]
MSNTQLQGVKSTGGTMTGAAVVGATLKGVLSNYNSIDLRIDASALLPAPNNDVRVYSISYKSTSGQKPLCVGPTGANEAILFPGSWNLTTVRHQADYNMFTVSCRGATFAKCEELGYKGDSMIDTYHQACVRALRADYCGDGVSHTVDGTQINIYDRLGIQPDTQAWAVEANWTTEGAICIAKNRLGMAMTTPSVPQCMASKATIPCTTASWPGGVLIRTEVNR